MIEVGLALASVVCLCAAMVAQPQRARCPPRWRNDGVRRDGSFECLRPLVGGVDDQPGTEDNAVQPPGELLGRIYCTGGSVPVVVDARTVGCEARH